MNSRAKNVIKKSSIGLLASVFLVLGLMYVVPLFFMDKINKEVRIVIQEQIKGEVTFDRIDLSFFKNFPYLTATISEPHISGIQTELNEGQALFEAQSVSLGIDVLGLLSSALNFDKIFIENPSIQILIDEEGKANYDIFNSTTETEESAGAFDLKIQELHIHQAQVVYNDLASKLSFVAQDFEYSGRGNMSDAVFDLQSKARIQSFDFNFDGVHYVKEKPIEADLETTVNTASLRFAFNRSAIKIKELPVSFKGFFGFIEQGYDMLFDIQTSKANLVELFSIVPPEYQTWLANMRMEGSVDAAFRLEGPYVISENLNPSVDLKLKIENGLLQHGTEKKPLSDLNVLLHVQLPELDIQQNKVDLDELSFNLNGKTSRIKHHSTGWDRLVLQTELDLNTDLDLFKEAVGLEGFDMRGEVQLQATAAGLYTKGIRKRKRLKKTVQDTIIASIPKFDMNLKVADGYFKFSQLPEAIEEVQVEVAVQALDSILKNTSIDLKQLRLLAMDNKVEAEGIIKNLRNFDMDASLSARVDLENLKQFMPVAGMEVRGLIAVEGAVKGTFEPRRKRFPIIDTEFKMENGYVHFDRVPELPIEDIHIHTVVNSKRGSMKDLTIRVLPIDFKIGGEPFQLAASLYNLNDLNYNVRSKGVLNLENFYKLFKIDGLDIKGKLITNLFLSGLQSDAVNGNFDKLKNGGSFEVADIWVASDLFPKPMWVKKGKFKFFKEKMKFERFEAEYGASKFNMEGHLTNVIGYMFNQDTLGGSFEFKTPYLNVDEFMVNSSSSSSGGASSSASGVIQVPANLNIGFHATADEIKFSEYHLKDFKGDLHLNKGSIVLEETIFGLIGTQVSMSGDYTPKGFKKAAFKYQIKASDFDIQRAYHEIGLFREMVSMAKDAYGTVSVDYALAGDLDKELMPVMPSLKGAGVLSLNDIQFKGFKLLGAIAEKTETSALENGKVSDVDIHSTIENNVLTIDRTRMRMAGFRPRFEGQVSLDGTLNIGLRLGLPPMGIIGIPMRITGTADAFNIKIGKYKPSEVLGNSDYDEEEEDEGTDVNSIHEVPEEPEVPQQPQGQNPLKPEDSAAIKVES